MASRGATRFAQDPLERTDGETAEVIKQAVAERIKERIPAPGSQEALRRMLDAGRAGNPNYDRMSTDAVSLALASRLMRRTWVDLLQYLGDRRDHRLRLIDRDIVARIHGLVASTR